MLVGKTLLSRYRVTQELGSGGFGDTYKAIDIALPSTILSKVQDRLANSTTGSIFDGGSSVGVKLSDKL